MLAQQYGRCLDSVLVEFRRTVKIADVAEAPTGMLFSTTAASTSAVRA
ncbi:hypothetical protein [Streptomyces sp. NPDC006307]